MYRGSIETGVINFSTIPPQISLDCGEKSKSENIHNPTVNITTAPAPIYANCEEDSMYENIHPSTLWFLGSKMTRFNHIFRDKKLWTNIHCL